MTERRADAESGADTVRRFIESAEARWVYGAPLCLLGSQPPGSARQCAERTIIEGLTRNGLRANMARRYDHAMMRYNVVRSVIDYAALYDASGPASALIDTVSDTVDRLRDSVVQLRQVCDTSGVKFVQRGTLYSVDRLAMQLMELTHSVGLILDIIQAEGVIHERGEEALQR